MNKTFADRVRVEVRDEIAYATMIRGDKFNGLDWDMFQGLIEAAAAIGKDKSIRVTILQGEGKAFCAGLDFKSFTAQPARMVRSFVKTPRRSTNLFQESAWCWRRLAIPVIAVVHGRCYGGGIQIALAADFRYATPDCEFSIMEAKWGLIPDMSGTVALRQLVGIDIAKELTMTGRIFGGHEAKSLGLVTGVADDPLQPALALAEQIKTRSPDCISAGKALFDTMWSQSDAEAFATERRIQRKLLYKGNQREAMKANFEKRTPKWAPRSVKF
jgi:enoyl-CoA hydratase/carnithine racemase